MSHVMQALTIGLRSWARSQTSTRWRSWAGEQQATAEARPPEVASW
jgi:hypothetical protein